VCVCVCRGVTFPLSNRVRVPAGAGVHRGGDARAAGRARVGPAGGGGPLRHQAAARAGGRRGELSGSFYSALDRTMLDTVFYYILHHIVYCTILHAALYYILYYIIYCDLTAR
jgi:hypothetical protein